MKVAHTILLILAVCSCTWALGHFIIVVGDFTPSAPAGPGLKYLHGSGYCMLLAGVVHCVPVSRIKKNWMLAVFATLSVLIAFAAHDLNFRAEAMGATSAFDALPAASPIKTAWRSFALPVVRSLLMLFVRSQEGSNSR